MKRFASILITPWLTRSVPKRGPSSAISLRQRADRVAEGEKRCRERRRDRALPCRGARGAGLGSLFCRLEVRGRSERTKARERTLARKSNCKRSAGAGIVYLGQVDEAERHARQAVELDPLSVTAQGNLARVLFVAGKLDEADAVARKAAELQPAAAGNHRWQVLVAVAARRRRDGAAGSATGARRRLSPFRTCACLLCARDRRGRRRGVGRHGRQ